MTDPIELLRNTDGIASVEECEIPDVDYYVTAEQGYEINHIRTIWLKHLREDFGWTGESEYHAATHFALLTEKAE